MAGQPVAADSLEKEVWLGRDILDSLVLELRDRRATRANDLWLDDEGGQWHLHGADTTVRRGAAAPKPGALWHGARKRHL